MPRARIWRVFRRRQVVPAPVFDTRLPRRSPAMTTRRLQRVGGKSPGTSAVINQRADWAARPLTPELVAHAADDVRYSARCTGIWNKNSPRSGGGVVGGRMRRADRRETLPQRSRTRLAAPSNSGKTLTPTQQPVLAQLAAWRERVAQQKNLSTRLGGAGPGASGHRACATRNPGQLAAIPGMEPALARRFGGEILAIVDQGNDLSRSGCGESRRGRNPSSKGVCSMPSAAASRPTRARTA